MVDNISNIFCFCNTIGINFKQKYFAATFFINLKLLLNSSCIVVVFVVVVVVVVEKKEIPTMHEIDPSHRHLLLLLLSSYVAVDHSAVYSFCSLFSSSFSCFALVNVPVHFVVVVLVVVVDVIVEML